MVGWSLTRFPQQKTANNCVDKKNEEGEETRGNGVFCVRARLTYRPSRPPVLVLYVPGMASLDEVREVVDWSDDEDDHDLGRAKGRNKNRKRAKKKKKKKKKVDGTTNRGRDGLEQQSWRVPIGHLVRLWLYISGFG